MADFTIIVADDDQDDFQTLKEAFDKLALNVTLKHVLNGQLLLQWLEKCLKESKALPQLVILDINMPKIDGIEALKKIKSHPLLGELPVYMYSTSTSVDQMKKCLQIGAIQFAIKGYSFENTLAFVTSVNDYLQSRQGKQVLDINI